MKRAFIYILIILTYGCSDNSNERTFATKKEKTRSAVENNKSKPIKDNIGSPEAFIDSTNFKFFNLKKFDLRGWYYGRFHKELQSFDSKEKLKTYFQTDRINETEIYPENFQYFSIQKIDKNEKIITLVEGDESCCHDLHYLIYDSQNLLLSDNIIAGSGGDGMWTYYQYGEFTNDSTYTLTRIDKEEIELNNEESEIQIDSVITQYRFHKRKPFVKLSEQKFQSRKK